MKLDEESTKPTKSIITRSRYTYITAVSAAIIVLGVGFAGGIAYQKTHQEKSGSASSTSASQRLNQMGSGAGDPNGGFNGGSNSQTGRQRGQMGDMRNRVFGPVTAISSTSITVQDARTSTDTTLKIDSSTKVTSNGTTAAVTDIKTGDQVIVQKSTADTSVAAQITLNPSMSNGSSQPSQPSGGASGTGGPGGTIDQNDQDGDTSIPMNGVGAGGGSQVSN